MKSLKKTMLFAVIVFLTGTVNGFAQKGYGHHGHYGHYGPHPHKTKVVVVKKSPWHPATAVVYHPYWGPNRAIYRRWVFFPRYNIYWDNWRNQYVWWNNTAWISQPAPPAVIVNVNLDNEKQYVLKESDDDNDDVYQTNSAHQKQYTPE